MHNRHQQKSNNTTQEAEALLNNIQHSVDGLQEQLDQLRISIGAGNSPQQRNSPQGNSVVQSATTQQQQQNRWLSTTNTHHPNPSNSRSHRIAASRNQNSNNRTESVQNQNLFCQNPNSNPSAKDFSFQVHDRVAITNKPFGTPVQHRRAVVTDIRVRNGRTQVWFITDGGDTTWRIPKNLALLSRNT